MDGVHAAALWEEGLRYKGPTTDPLGRVLKHELRIGRAESLSVFAGEYAFFTPALLYLLGIVSDQPLCDLMWELRRDVPVWFKKFRWPLFRGLEAPDGDSAWNHALWAVRRQDWEAFHPFYCSLAIRVHADDGTSRMDRIASQQLLVVDPLKAERGVLLAGRAATIEVTAFGVNGTAFVAAFERGTDPMMDPPRLRYWPPSKATRVFAAALDRGENPHTAEEAYNRRHHGASQA